ncbi:MAG: hypothetical protein PVG07_02775 [Acidobacteriota bacterium]
MTPPVRTTAGPAPRPAIPAVLAVLAVLLTCSAAPAQAPPAAPGGPPGLASLFPHRAPILLDGPAGTDGRLARLLVPPEVLSSCRPDLSDLRILDPGGREVPFLVDAGRGSGEPLEVLETVRPEILGADRTTIERDGVPDLRRESYELSAPPPTRPGEGWELVVESERARFVRRIVVAPAPLEPDPAKGPDRSDRPERPDRVDPVGAAEGSIFRLPAAPSSLHVREHLRLPLPLSVSSLAGERLRVTLEGEEGSYLEPGFRYERSRRLPGRARARVPLTVLAVRSGDRRTVVELERPRGLVPDLLALETATPAFSRRVEVWDEGPGAVDAALGSTTLYRVPAVATVENLEIPLYPARGDRLRLVIHDGDSPPLEEPVFRAAVRRPALLFGLESAGEEPAGTLLFGGGRAYRPHYDLAALQAALAATRTPDGAGGEEGPISSAAAHIVRSLVDPDRLAPARLGPIEANPRHDPSPALAFAHRPGAPVDAALYRHRRSLQATPSGDGLSSLPLTPEDLARARADLGDLRIVDPRARQWAYLVERGAERDLRELPAERVASERRGLSRYEIDLPARPATVDRLIVDCSAAFFDRPFTLRGTPPGAGSEDAQTLVRGRLRRRVGDPRPVTLAFPAARIDRLVLEIEDGDDAPLEIRRVEGRFPLPTLYFPAPQGEYALLLGNPEGEAPRYELTRARDLVLAVTAEPARTGPLGENPEYRAGRRLLSKEGVQRLLLWAALGAAVLALAFLTLRLARRG